MQEKTTKKEKKQAEEIEHLKAQLEQAKADYRALRDGRYVLDSVGHSREPMYRVSTTLWGGSCGRGYGSVSIPDLKTAKLVELALQKIFPGCEIETLVNKDINAESCNEWRRV